MYRKRTNRFAAGAAAVLCALSLCGCRGTQAPAAADTAPRAVGEPLSGGEQTVASAGAWQLTVEASTGEFAVENQAAGVRWRSNPTAQEREADEIAKGNGRALLASALRIEYQDALGNISASSGYTASVRKDGLRLYAIEDGFRAEYTFVDEEIVIPLDVQLQPDGLHCSVPVAEIQELGENRLLTLTLLPAFGAAGPEEEGYFLVPDGSGALIRFNNGKYLYDSFSMPVYGAEAAREQDALAYTGENVLLPVFGVSKGTSGLLAVISEGAAGASVEASVAGKSTSYNLISAAFTLRSTEGYTIGTSVGVTKEVRLYQEGALGGGSLGVTYRFLDEGQADYAGMAVSCREWLLGRGWLPEQKTAALPLYVRLLGGALKEKSVLGIPTKQVEKLTGFAQAADILRQLEESGADDLTVLLEGWSQPMLQGKIDVKASPALALGGKKELAALQALCREQGTALYLDSEFQKTAKWGSGYSSFLHAARTVSGVPATVSRYDLASRLAVEGTQENLLSPGVFTDVFGRFLAGLQKQDESGETGLGMGSAAYMLYSDYGAGYSREQSALAVQAALGQAKASGRGLVGCRANAYVWPYADSLLALPLTSSRYNIEDETVPFLQMVLKGYIPYSTPSVNQADDPQEMFLQAVETGSGLLFTLIGGAAQLTRDTVYAEYTSASAAEWIGPAAEYQQALAQLAAQIGDSTIVGHSRRGSLSATAYENGVTVYVNYGSAAAQWGDTQVPARSYTAVREDSVKGGA